MVRPRSRLDRPRLACRTRGPGDRLRGQCRFDRLALDRIKLELGRTNMVIVEGVASILCGRH